MKHLFLVPLLALGLWAQGTPNCSQALSFTSATPGTSINTIAGASAGCAGWRLTWSVTGFTAATIQLEGSQDNSSWSAFGSTLVQEGTNPTSWTSATTSNTIVVRASQPYVRVNITGVTGSGTIKTLILGYSGTSAQNDNGGGGSGGSCASLGGDLTGTCTAAVVVQARSGKVTFDSSGDVVAAGSYTSGSGSGLTGALDLTGATSGHTVTVTVGTSTAAGTLTAPGATGNLNYIASPGTSGHCVQLASDGIGLVDAGFACASGAGGAIGWSNSGNSLSSGTTYFIAPVGGSAVNTTEANVQGRATTAGPIANLYVQLTAAPGTGNSLAFTLRDGGTGESLTCTISNAATTCNDTTHTFTPAANDLINFQMVDTGVTATVGIVITYTYGSSGSSGALTQISKQTLASPAATVTFSGIPGSYTNLLLTINCRGSAVTTVDGYMQFNGDTGANYSRTFVGVASGSSSTGQQLNASQVGIVAVADSGEVGPGTASITIYNYATTTDKKFVVALQSMMSGGTSTAAIQQYSVAMFWNSSAAISSITLGPESGNFAANSTFTLYGMQ